MRAAWIGAAVCLAALALAGFTAITTAPRRVPGVGAGGERLSFALAGASAAVPADAAPGSQARGVALRAAGGGSPSGAPPGSGPGSDGSEPAPASASKGPAEDAPAIDPQEALQLERESRLYEPQAVVLASGWLAWSGHRLAQSVRWHLAAIPELERLPLARRPELAAMASAATVLRSEAVAGELATLAPPHVLAQARRALGRPRMHELAVHLSTTVMLQQGALQALHAEVHRLDEWRASAVASIARASGQEAYELAIAERALPYVLASLGLAHDRATVAAAAVSLARARVHHATRALDAQALYRLATDLAAPPARMAFGAVGLAASVRMDDFLAAFATGLSAAPAPVPARL